MPRIAVVDIEARSRLTKRTKGFDARAPFREAITNLDGDSQFEVVPDDGETLRGLRLNLARAAKEANRDVVYGETDEGTLIVWLRDKPKQKRGPRKQREN
jgi:hypothetical protein